MIAKYRRSYYGVFLCKKKNAKGQITFLVFLVIFCSNIDGDTYKTQVYTCMSLIDGNCIKVALQSNKENFQYLELKTHNFVITQGIAKHEVPNGRGRNKL